MTSTLMTLTKMTKKNLGHQEDLGDHFEDLDRDYQNNLGHQEDDLDDLDLVCLV